MSQYTYLLINFCSILVPFLFSFHPKLQFYKRWRAFFPAMLITASFFLLWDSIFTGLGVWGFNPVYVSGYFIAGLPIEEWLFFLCIPYACVFTYHCLDLLIKGRISESSTRMISLGLIIFLLSGAIINYDKYYTALTFFLCAGLTGFCQFYLKAEWLGRFYIVYSILLIPFLIVNGLLTGTGLDAPVVWYNEAHILGFRILTIPFEDVFYGMLLILGNVGLFKYFSAKESLAVAD